MELKEQILKALGLSSEVKFEVQAKLLDGTIIVSTAEALVEGADIAVLTEDGTTIELPIGEYETEDGVTFVVEEAGVIATIGEAEVVEEEAPVEEEEVEAAELSEFDSLEKRIANLEVVIAELKGDTEVEEELAEETTEETTEEEITEPSENPRTVTTKTTEVVEFSVEELKAENERLKEELAKQPATQPVGVNKFTEASSTKLSTAEYRKLSRKERYWYNIKNN
jgi:hypothetical protein